MNVKGKEEYKLCLQVSCVCKSVVVSKEQSRCSLHDGVSDLTHAIGKGASQH